MRTVICDAVSTQLIKASVLLNICSQLSEGRGLSHDTDDSFSVWSCLKPSELGHIVGDVT